MKFKYLLFILCFSFCFGNNASAQLVGDQIFLQGRWLEVGVAPNGAWGNTRTVPAGYHSHGGSAITGYTDPLTGAAATGDGLDFSYDAGHDGWTTGSPAGSVCCFYGSYFLPGTPFDGWSIQMNGTGGGTTSSAYYSNPGFSLGTGVTSFSGTNVSYAFNPGSPCTAYPQSNAAGTWLGSYTVGGGTVSIRQTNYLDTNASWDHVNVVFKNTGATPITDLYYLVTGDPDDDEVTDGGMFPTNNHISYQNDAIHRSEVNSRPPSLHQDAFSGLATRDCRAKAMIYQSWPPSLTVQLSDMWAGTTAVSAGTFYYTVGQSTLSQDIAYGLVYNLGTLAPGDSTMISYAWIFSDTAAIDSAFQDPKMNVNCVLAPTHSYTISPCPQTSFPVNIINGLWGTANWKWAPSVGLATTTGISNSVNVLLLPGTTTYTITPTDTLSCDHFEPFYLTVMTCFSATNNGPICLGDTLKLGAHGDSTGATYTWFGPGLTGPVLGTGQFLNIYPSTFADSGIIYVIKTVGGLNDTTNTHVVIVNRPAVTATSNSPVCTGDSLLLHANPAAVGETFTWSGPNAFSSGVQNPFRYPAIMPDSGIYKVVSSLLGCKDSGYVHVVIDSTPEVPVAASNSPVCSGNILMLTATDATAGVTYRWDGPLGFISGLQNPNITGVTTGASGIYTVTASLGACHSSDTTTVVVNLTPPIPTLTSNSPVCSGNSLNLTATSTAGSSYSWTGPNAYTSAVQNPVINPATTAATGIYTVTATLNGCTSRPGFISVTVDSTPQTPTIGSNSPICSGNPILLTSSDVTAGVSYSWSGPLGFTSVLQNPTIPSSVFGNTGTYTVTVNIGVCTATATTFVQVNPTPPLPVLGSNAPICSGSNLDLTALSLTGSAYSWTGPNGFTSSLQNPSIAPANTLATGTYSVTASLNGCTSPVATIYVVVDSTPAIPVVSSNSPGSPAICEGDTLKLMATDGTAGVTYTWVGPNTFTSSVQNPYILNVTMAAVGEYTVTVHEGTCTASAVTVVTVTATPPLTATSNSPLCTAGDTLFLFANSDAGATYSWMGPHVFISYAQNPFRFPLLLDYGGIYQVTVLSHGCTNTVDDTVIVHETPGPPWMSWLTYCKNYDAPPLQSNGINILWYPSSNTTGVTGSPIAPTPPTTVDTVLWYFSTQTVLGCESAIDSFKVTVQPTPTVTVSPPASVCPHDSVVLTATDTDPVAYYHWIPRMYLSDTDKAIVTSHPETDITYSVIASNEFGCTDTASVNIFVHPAAVINIEDSAILYPGETYQLSPQTNCYVFEWSPTIGLDNPYISNPLASPEASTRYYVTGITGWGCKATDSIEIYINEESLITIANAFAPGNGPNAEFKVLIRGTVKLNYFRIWDRWGVKVFETSDISKGWDGSYKGTPQPFGVYVYEIGALTNKGRLITKHGNVTLIR